MDAKPKRRWLSFSVRTLLIAVTIFCVWLGSQASIVRHRRALRVKMEFNGSVLPEPNNTAVDPFLPADKSRAPSRLRKLLGDEEASEVHFTKMEDAALLREVIEAFPEAEVFVY